MAEPILVTGGSGILGHYVIDELYARGYAVVNGDAVAMGDLQHSGNISKVSSANAALKLRDGWDETPAFEQLDIANYEQVRSAMAGCRAVIALAARPTPFNYPEEDIIHTNTMAIWNVCKAAEELQIKRIALGSSYNAIGAQATAMARNWARELVKPPAYFPLDSATASRAEDAYSISKWAGEHIADAFIRRSPQMSIASLRFTGVWDDDYFATLNANPISDPWERCQGFWGYVNIRDVARACVLAIEAPDWNANARLFINAKDTMLDIPTSKALSAVYPNVKLRREFGEFEAVFDIGEAQKIVGWTPNHSWRDKQYQAN